MDDFWQFMNKGERNSILNARVFKQLISELKEKNNASLRKFNKFNRSFLLGDRLNQLSIDCIEQKKRLQLITENLADIAMRLKSLKK